MAAKSDQMVLGVALDSFHTLDNFYAPAKSPQQQAVTVLREGVFTGEQFIGEQSSGEQAYVYLWGNSGSGVSHLLQGACHQALQNGLTVQYLPLDSLLDYPPEALLEGLEQTHLVCLDNLQSIAGNAQWEQALFHLFNQIKSSGGRLLAGANASPKQLAIQLPDLQSRLSSGLSLQLPPLTDEQKAELLQFCARQRGLELEDKATQYLLSRLPRGMHELVAVLDRLDKVSLQAQRKLTVPFIRQALVDEALAEK
ncbi:DnaA regulatory inactivator Hda [bacterium SCSIO 12696]|nr:DnaA regulatory inactivator Hda [bacterium SCSIO 12696]